VKLKLRISQNSVLRKVFTPKRVEVTGCWRNLHNVELHNLYSSLNIIKIMNLRKTGRADHASCMSVMKNAYRLLVREPENKRSLLGPIHR
jgi:hypothetical protein